MNTTRTNNRKGVTLLFVVSMIVLFLLMGTTFVVVANNFLRSAKNQSRLNRVGIENANSGTGRKFVQHALYELLRGPDLDNSESPLRGHSLLADMYGYGLTAYVKAIDINVIERPGTNASEQPQFVRLQTIGLDTHGLSRDDRLNQFVLGNRIVQQRENDQGALLTDPVDMDGSGSFEPEPDKDGFALNAAPGRFNGQIITFSTGRVAGLSARIIDHQVFPVDDAANDVMGAHVYHEHVFILQLINSVTDITVENLVENIDQWDVFISNGTVPEEIVPTQVVINGQPFNGTGTGQFRNTGRLDNSPAFRAFGNQITDINPALLPNRRYESGFSGGSNISRFAANYLGFDDGSANPNIPGNDSAPAESYDAYDFQNMFLAGLYYQLQQDYLQDNFDNDDDGLIDEEDEAMLANIPSFHRRELQRFVGVHDTRNGAPFLSNDEIISQLRYSFRPELFVTDMQNIDRPHDLSTASANFPGIIDPDSEALFGVPLPHTFERRPLDVDNDGDGILDGVWMDIGLPTVSTENGRLVRPLVSFLVSDMDSKLNLNLHGNRSQLISNKRFKDPLSDLVTMQDGLGSDVDGNDELRMLGVGFGPAEIDLNQAFPPEEFRRLLIGELDGDRNVVVPGRYGYNANAERSFRGGAAVPGMEYVDSFDNGQDAFSLYKFFGYPNLGSTPGGVLGGFFQSSPMDIYGRLRVDYPTNGALTGMPVIDVAASSLNLYSEIVNNPYEIDFTGRHDTLFSLSELEAVYRRFDHDSAGLAGRLPVLAPSLLESFANRTLTTTDSWEVPTLFADFVENGGRDSLYSKLYQILSKPNNGSLNSIGISPPPNNAGDVITREQMVLSNIAGFMHVKDPLTDELTGDFEPDTNRRSMLSMEVRERRPFDINRPFGNGLDDEPDDPMLSRNGVIDEPTEYDVAAQPEILKHPNEENYTIDHDNDAVPNRSRDNGYLARHRFARDLYMLVLLTTETVDRDGDGSIFNGNILDNDDFVTFATGGGGTPTNADREAYRRTVAQWVANVVDFRDPDSIMTAFEFDLNPFNGWDVDGLVSSDEGGDREVVWGAERPELLITETLATHNKNEQDTADEPGSDADTMMDGDQDLDSRMAPVASAFFELYNPWLQSADINNLYNNQIPGAELDPTQTGVDLALRTPADPDDMTVPQDPVWRIAAVPGMNPEWGSGGIGANDTPFVPSVDPDDPHLTTPAKRIRYVYFTVPDSNTLNVEGIDMDRVYHPVSAIVPENPQIVRPGGYAVVGSAGVKTASDSQVYKTYFGRRMDAVDDIPNNYPMDPNTALKLNMSRRIELDIDQNQVRVDDNGTQYSFDANEVVVLPISGPINVPVADDRRSFGLSDPEMGYTGISSDGQPYETCEIEDGDGPFFCLPGSGQRATADTPADMQLMSDHESGVQKFLAKDEEGLHNSAFVVLLQRLADPTQRWDEETNPYITTDSSSVDLFVFNGFDPPMTPPANSMQENFFGSYERRSDMTDTEYGQDMASGRFRMLWRTEYEGLQPTSDSGDMSATHLFERNLYHSLGRLNAAYQGVPGPAPFSWLTWHNRPFMTKYELSLVPYTSSYFLTNQYGVSRKGFMGWGGPYDYQNSPPEVRSPRFAGEFPHLLNFHTDDKNVAEPNHQPTSPQLHKIFDYVEVPSRYLGTETFLNPSKFEVIADVDQPDTNPTRKYSMTRGFAPPFDYVSNYRVPGKININTITDHRVYNALMRNYALNFNELDLPTGDINEIKDERFNEWVTQARFNPYRTSHAYNWVPTLATGSSLVVGQADTGLFRRSMEADIRNIVHHPNGGGTHPQTWPYIPSSSGLPTEPPPFVSAPGDVPLFDYDPVREVSARAGIANDSLNSASRNAFFRYNKRNRLGNMVTSRSSMFSIWITVGYFEIETVQTDGNGPKLVFGAEAVDDFGQPTRNRGFYIFDRSIPVAFEPGKNHNVQNAIRVSSFIE